MRYNINSGYGARANALPLITGKYFLVAPSTHPNYQTLQELWQNDPEGERRLFATIAEAYAAAVAGRGDVILVAEGHSTTVSAAAGLVFNKANVTIQGLGTGANRPLITVSGATSADIDITAKTTLRNFRIDLTGIDALVAPFDVRAEFVFEDNDVTTATATNQTTLGILTTADARLIVRRNTFVGSADAGTATVIRIVGGDRHVISDNLFIGNYTAALGAIENNTTACTNTVIEKNFIYNRTASSTKAMVFAAASTGVIKDNRMQILNGTAPITGAAMSWVGGNYYANAVATAGTLI